MYIPKNASMLEIMQIGQLSNTSDFIHRDGRLLEDRYDDQIAEAMQEDIARVGNTTGNKFLFTQIEYDGPVKRLEIKD